MRPFRSQHPRRSAPVDRLLRGDERLFNRAHLPLASDDGKQRLHQRVDGGPITGVTASSTALSLTANNADGDVLDAGRGSRERRGLLQQLDHARVRQQRRPDRRRVFRVRVRRLESAAEGHAADGRADAGRRVPLRRSRAATGGLRRRSTWRGCCSRNSGASGVASASSPIGASRRPPVPARRCSFPWPAQAGKMGCQAARIRSRVSPAGRNADECHRSAGGSSAR